MNITTIVFRFPRPRYPLIGRMTDTVELTSVFLTDKTDIQEIVTQVIFDRHFAHMPGIEAMQNAVFCSITLSNGQRWVVKDLTGRAPYLEP